jgi:anti-sigma regulatory factor (Ser/Thr protein kinase)
MKRCEPAASVVASRAVPHERLELVIGNRPEELARVAARLDDLAARRGLPVDAVADMHVALEEILANVLSHAYDDEAAHEIRVSFGVYADALEAAVEDDGRPFDPLTIPPPDLSSPLAEREVGGLGIHLVRKLMSEVTYRRIGDRNRLVLTKAFGAGPDPR